MWSYQAAVGSVRGFSCSCAWAEPSVQSEARLERQHFGLSPLGSCFTFLKAALEQRLHASLPAAVAPAPCGARFPLHRQAAPRTRRDPPSAAAASTAHAAGKRQTSRSLCRRAQSGLTAAHWRCQLLCMLDARLT